MLVQQVLRGADVLASRAALYDLPVRHRRPLSSAERESCAAQPTLREAAGDARWTGFSYLPLAVGIIIAAGLASQLVTRIGFKPTLIAGLLLITGGLLWFSRVPAPGGSWTADVLGPSLLAAVGFGFAFVSVTIAAVTGTRPHEAGLASGLINTSQQIGGALGLAILATIANSRTQSLLHSGVHSASVALTKGFDRAFLVGAGFALIGAILAFVLISSRESRAHSAAARSGDPTPAAAAG
jgi:MFS family permease